MIQVSVFVQKQLVQKQLVQKQLAYYEICQFPINYYLLMFCSIGS
jgi:hypothetical protein